MSEGTSPAEAKKGKYTNDTAKPSHVELLSAQVGVALIAVEALIANHPEPEKVRATFDQLFGQIQAGLLVRGMTPLGSQAMRQLTEKIFASPVAGD